MIVYRRYDLPSRRCQVLRIPSTPIRAHLDAPNVLNIETLSASSCAMMIRYDDDMMWILGTPGLYREPCNQRLLPLLPDSVAIDRPAWNAETLGELRIAARCLVLVGSASAAVSNRITGYSVKDAELDELMVACENAVNHYLRLVHTNRERVLLVHPTSVQTHPLALATLCTGLTGRHFHRASAIPASAVDGPLDRVVVVPSNDAVLKKERLRTQLEPTCGPFDEGDRLAPSHLLYSKAESSAMRFGPGPEKRVACRQWAVSQLSDHDVAAALLHTVTRWVADAADMPGIRAFAKAVRRHAEARTVRWRPENPGRVPLLDLQTST